MSVVKFPKHHHGADEASLLALVLFYDLLGLLREKGVLAPDEVTGLLETAASRLSEDRCRRWTGERIVSIYVVSQIARLRNSKE